MREWCVITLGLGSKLFELVPGDRSRRRRYVREVQDWRRGRRAQNPRTEATLIPPAP